MAVLADTGAIFAVIDASDLWHQACREFVESQQEHLVVPCSILPEIDYLISTRLQPGLTTTLLSDVQRGSFLLEDVRLSDLARTAAIMEACGDLGIGLVDASIVAVAERLGIDTIFTLDRKHFSVVRPRHVPEFKLVPEVV